MNLSNIYKVLRENNLDKKIDGIDYFDFHKDRFNFLVEKLKQHYGIEKSFLEIGSLRGYMMIAAHLIGYARISGVDLSRFVDETKEMCKKYNFTNLPLDLKLDNLPFADNSFDVILLSEVLEHLNFHPGKVFCEISRVLKINGVVIITTPNLSRLNNLVKLFLNKSINAELDQPFNESTHYREYTANEIKYLLKIGGLKSVETNFVNFKYPHLGIRVAVSDFLSIFLPNKKRDICVIGKK